MADVEKPTTLPDDPRECCKAILAELSKIDDWPTGSMPEDFAGLVRAVCEGPPEAMLDGQAGLKIMAAQTEEVAKLHRQVVQKCWDLAAHGTGSFKRDKAAA